MRLTDDVYEYIKQEVIDLFVRYDIRRIPISGDSWRKKIGMTLIPYSALSKGGALTWVDVVHIPRGNKKNMSLRKREKSMA